MPAGCVLWMRRGRRFGVADPSSSAFPEPWTPQAERRLFFCLVFSPCFPPKSRSGSKTDSRLRLLVPLKHCWPFFHGNVANSHVS